MSGPDGDDDEELVEIDVELEGPPDAAAESSSPSAVPDPVDTGDDTERSPLGALGGEPPPAGLLGGSGAAEAQPPMVEAANDDPAAALAVVEAEAAVAEGGRRSALLLEATRLFEVNFAGAAPDGPARALRAARAAFEADRASARALWVLRRRLIAVAGWEELAERYEQAIAARAAAAPRVRADLLIERGRLLEDRLGRPAAAVACYRAALAASRDHPAALLALLLAGTKLGDATLRAEAHNGLARRADTAGRRSALVIEEALAWRASGVDGGPARALAALEGELGRGEARGAVGALLIELDALTRGAGDLVPAPVAVRALEALEQHVAPVDPAFGFALARERTRLLRRSLAAPEAALAALDQAARRDPGHPLVAAERLDLALAMGRRDVAGEIARAFVAEAARDDDAVDLALAYAEAVFEPGRPDAVWELLRVPRVRACRRTRADLRAVELAIAVVRSDAAGLADAFVGEADPETHADAGSRAAALAAAAALRGDVLGQSDAAAELYQRAIAAADTPARARPAVQALAALRAAEGRIEDAASVLESALTAAAGEAGEPTGAREAFELWARASLVAFYADELGAPARALPHQRRLVALRPQELGQRVRLVDLDLASGAEGLAPAAGAENLEALAAAAGDPVVANALQVAAGRALLRSSAADERARGVALLATAAPGDASGLAAASLEREAPSALARAEIVAAELEAAAVEPSVERTRALRFRLAHHRAEAGAFAEAMAALTPLRSEGDPLARAWSYELARRANDAFLELAVLSEEARAPDGTLGDEGGVLLAHGEALARAGDPQGAADSFRAMLARAPACELAADAALGLLRLASTDPAGTALPAALQALSLAAPDDPALAAAAAREAALAGAAVGVATPADLPDAEADDLVGRAERTLLRFMTGARGGAPEAVAVSLVEMARSMIASSGTPSLEAVALLARGAARARLAGVAAADAVASVVWQTAHSAALAPALADLPVAAAAPWPPARPDPRRARARRTGGPLGIALHLEAALDAERAGALGAALAAYGNAIALAPERLEVWTGVRRVARAGGDRLGEARALARLGVLVREPLRAAALLVEAGAAYQDAGRVDDAIAALGRAFELWPDDAALYARVHALLHSDLGAPGRAVTLDGLLSYRLTAGTPAPAERIALLFERAAHREGMLGDHASACRDLKEILKLDPQHVASLHKLAQGAIAEQDHGAAIIWLQRYLAAAPPDDAERVAAAALDLAACHDLRGESLRAIETLQAAALARPTDPTPLERAAEIQLRRRDLRGAIASLWSAAERVGEPSKRAALLMRGGAILRDAGRDPAGAAAAFQQASDLEPLGPGAAALVALHDAASNAPGALEVVTREIADLRRALALDPLDGRRLERLGEWLVNARRRGVDVPPEAEAAIANVRGLLGAPAVPLSAPARVAPIAGRGFILEIAAPAAGGFVAEVWPHLIEAAAALFPAPSRARPAPLGPALAARFAWVAAVAAAVGIPRLTLAIAREADAPPVVAVDEPDAALILGEAALSSPALPFLIGRGLGTIAARAAVLARAAAADLAPLFAAAAVLAGAPVPAGLPEPTEALLRDVTRAVGRKDRKALGLQASRFGFEAFDLAAWRTATVRAADRFGLLVVGDAAQAAAALAGGPKAIAGNPAARELLGFALSDRYPALRRAIEGAGG